MMPPGGGGRSPVLSITMMTLFLPVVPLVMRVPLLLKLHIPLSLVLIAKLNLAHLSLN